MILAAMTFIAYTPTSVLNGFNWFLPSNFSWQADHRQSSKQ